MGDDGIEWELEDLDGGVLYDVFYESTTMLAGRMLAQRIEAFEGGSVYVDLSHEDVYQVYSLAK